MYCVRSWCSPKTHSVFQSLAMFAAADVSCPQRCFVSLLTPAAAGVCLNISLQAAAPATPHWSVLSQLQPHHICRLSGLSPLCFRCYLEIVVWEAVEWLPHHGMLSSVMCVCRFSALPESPVQPESLVWWKHGSCISHTIMQTETHNC